MSTTSHPFSCNNCHVAFRTPELQRTHMQSEWHRYNLKRRVASLPPVSEDNFKEKVSQASAASNAQAQKVYFSRTCAPCAKTFSSENAYVNHLASAKHKANEKRSNAEPAPAKDVDAVTSSLKASTIADAESELEDTKMESDADPEAPKTEDGPIPPLTTCLFCNYASPTAELSLTHMERYHSLIIPEKAYLVDTEGLMRQLLEKVFVYNACIGCDRVKATHHAVQAHMKDAGHFALPYDTMDDQLAIGDFYDFRSTYADGECDSDYDSEADGWETDGEDTPNSDDDASSVASADLGRIVADDQPRRRIATIDTLYTDGVQLFLPGKAIGHRAHNRFWRQNLHGFVDKEDSKSDDPVVVAARNKARRVPDEVGRHNRGIQGISETDRKTFNKSLKRAINRDARAAQRRSVAIASVNNKMIVCPVNTRGG